MYRLLYGKGETGLSFVLASDPNGKGGGHVFRFNRFPVAEI